jgi:uncharacterized protein (DUF58 family)
MADQDRRSRMITAAWPERFRQKGGEKYQSFSLRNARIHLPVRLRIRSRTFLFISRYPAPVIHQAAQYPAIRPIRDRSGVS